MPTTPVPRTRPGHPPGRSLSSAPPAAPKHRSGVKGSGTSARPRSKAGRSTWKYRCPVADCHLRVRTSTTLKIHMRTHTGEKPLVCLFEGCDQRFAQSAHRTCHHRTHTGEKPWACPVEGCTRRFSQINTMQRHYRLHSSCTEHLCPELGCQQRFVMKSQMQEHRLDHFGQNLRVCTVAGCSRRFRRLDSLRKHQQTTHSKARPFCCPVLGCTSAFSLRDNLLRHQKIHSRNSSPAGPVASCNAAINGPGSPPDPGPVSPAAPDLQRLRPARPVSRVRHPSLQALWTPAPLPDPPVPLPRLSDDILQCLTQHAGQAAAPPGGESCLFSSEEPFERWMDPAAPAP